MNLDFSLVDQINRHQTERSEWEELKAAYKQAGELEAKIMVGLVGTILIIAALCLETPH